MKLIRLTVIMVTLLAAMPLAAADICTEQVPTQQGPVIGLATADGQVCEYRGIPYAKPPVGELRWQNPIPAQERSSVLTADSFSPVCVQSEDNTFKMPGEKKDVISEDCLYLNIWRPAKSGTFPVMVWIHGGSLLSGAGSLGIYRGDNIASRSDVILVSINYRLGALGFMAHPDLALEDPNDSTGNYGLLDQVAALRWVNDNIAGFGGDPGNITIFGESAGGWSVCNLLAAPPAAGLFDKAIIQSGGCDTTLDIEQGYQDSRELVELAGCQGDDPLGCMRLKSPDEILKAMGGFGKNNVLSPESFKFRWVPHHDGYALEQAPIHALRSGKFNQVPLMVGANRDEIKLFTVVLPGVRLAPKHLVRLFYKNMLDKQSLPELEALYPYRDYRRPADAAIDAFGDMALGCKCFDAANAVAGKQPVYYYRFDYDKHLGPHVAGAAHAIEIPFIFSSLDRPPVNLFFSRGQTKKAQVLSDQVMSYWTNFAKTADPNGPGLVEWPEYDKNTKMKIYLDRPVTTRATDNVQKCEFWSEQGLGLK